MAVLSPWDPPCISDDCAGGGGGGGLFYGPFAKSVNSNGGSLWLGNDQAGVGNMVAVLRDGTITGLSVGISSGDGTPDPLTDGPAEFEVYVNGVASGYSATVDDGDSSVADTTGTIPVVAGDLIGVQRTMTSTGTDGDGIAAALIEVTS